VLLRAGSSKPFDWLKSMNTGYALADIVRANQSAKDGDGTNLQIRRGTVVVSPQRIYRRTLHIHKPSPLRLQAKIQATLALTLHPHTNNALRAFLWPLQSPFRTECQHHLKDKPARHPKIFSYKQLILFEFEYLNSVESKRVTKRETRGK